MLESEGEMLIEHHANQSSLLYLLILRLDTLHTLRKFFIAELFLYEGHVLNNAAYPDGSHTR